MKKVVVNYEVKRLMKLEKKKRALFLAERKASRIRTASELTRIDAARDVAFGIIGALDCLADGIASDAWPEDIAAADSRLAELLDELRDTICNRVPVSLH